MENKISLDFSENVKTDVEISGVSVDLTLDNFDTVITLRVSQKDYERLYDTYMEQAGEKTYSQLEDEKLSLENKVEDLENLVEQLQERIK